MFNKQWPTDKAIKNRKTSGHLKKYGDTKMLLKFKKL